MTIARASVHRRSLTAGLLCVCAVTAQAQSAAGDSDVPPDDPFDRAIAHPLLEHFAPRILQGAARTSDRLPVAPPGTTGAMQSGELSALPLLWRDGAWTVKGSLAGTVGLFKMWHNEFDLPASQVTAGYKRDPAWTEYFVEPGVTAQYVLSPEIQLYGGAAYMGTATRGTDYSGVGNTWHGDMEQVYGGIRWTDKPSGVSLDASYGQQEFTVGRNLLIAAGASNGAQRGASYLGPRAAWAIAALGKATWRDLTARGFWLKPNDSTSASTGTRLSGIDVAWEPSGPLRLGAMYVYAPESAIVTRDGLNVYDLRARWHPAPSMPNLWLEGEAVWQVKPGVDAKGWYVAFNLNATTATWKPLVTLRYATFSGDKPDTTTWEGFDPLYYGGSTPDWYQGKVASTFLNNTNLDSVAATLTLTPNERTILQFIYLNFTANQVNAPLAIPSAGKLVPVGGGGPARSLGNEFDAVYTYTFDKRVNVNAFAGYLAPGAGYRELYASQGGSAQGWWALGLQFNVNY